MFVVERDDALEQAKILAMLRRRICTSFLCHTLPRVSATQDARPFIAHAQRVEHVPPPYRRLLGHSRRCAPLLEIRQARHTSMLTPTGSQDSDARHAVSEDAGARARYIFITPLLTHDAGVFIRARRCNTRQQVQVTVEARISLRCTVFTAAYHFTQCAQSPSPSQCRRRAPRQMPPHYCRNASPHQPLTECHLPRPCSHRSLFAHCAAHIYKRPGLPYTEQCRATRRHHYTLYDIDYHYGR